MNNDKEQYELEVILQTLTEAKTDLERMVKEYTKARLQDFRKQSRIDSKASSKRFKGQKGGK